MAKRRFIDAPDALRCTAEVTLRDGSTCPCGRYRKVGTLCTQHAKIEARKRSARHTGHPFIKSINWTPTP